MNAPSSPAGFGPVGKRTLETETTRVAEAERLARGWRETIRVLLRLEAKEKGEPLVRLID